MSLSVFAMACLALWIIGIACLGLSVQLEDDIPTIALVAGGLLLLLWGRQLLWGLLNRLLLGLHGGHQLRVPAHHVVVQLTCA